MEPLPGFGIGQYFPNFGEAISNSDLNASQYLYTITHSAIITYILKHFYSMQHMR